MKQPINFANPSGLPWILVEKVSTAVSELEEFGSQFETDLENSFLDTYLNSIMERKTRVDDAWRALDEIDEWIANPHNKITQEVANKRFLLIMITACSFA